MMTCLLLDKIENKTTIEAESSQSKELKRIKVKLDILD